MPHEHLAYFFFRREKLQFFIYPLSAFLLLLLLRRKSWNGFCLMKGEYSSPADKKENCNSTPKTHPLKSAVLFFFSQEMNRSRNFGSISLSSPSFESVSGVFI